MGFHIIYIFLRNKILTDVNFPMICGHASGKLFSIASKMLGLETCFISMGISICFQLTIIYKNCISDINGDEMIRVLVGIFIKRLWKNVDIFADLC